MNTPTLSLGRRLKAGVLSALAFCVTVACSLFDRGGENGGGGPSCYVPPPPPTDTPQVLCYEAPADPTDTPTPAVSPLDTPTPVCYTATPSSTPLSETEPGDREALLARLIEEGRFPAPIVQALKDR